MEYVDIAGLTGTYWLLPFHCKLSLACYSREFRLIYSSKDITVQDTEIPLTSIDSESSAPPWAAIDTGTTLIGGPDYFVSQVFAQVPGAYPGADDFEGYYIYRMSILWRLLRFQH